MATMTKTQRDAVLRKIEKAFKEKKEVFIKNNIKNIKLSKDEKQFITLCNKIHNLNEEIKNIQILRSCLREKLKIKCIYFGSVTEENFIRKEKIDEILPDKIKNFNLGEYEDDLILKDLKDFDIEDYINNILKELDD